MRGFLAKVKNEKGVTLVEIVVYLAILAILGGVVITFVIQTLGVTDNLRRSRGSLDSAQSALDAISQEVHYAEKVYKPTSCFDTSCATLGQLSLETTKGIQSDETDGFEDFYVDNGGLFVKKDGQAAQLLTSETVKVTKLTFTDLQGMATQQGEVRINITVEDAFGVTGPKNSVTLNTTATLRAY